MDNESWHTMLETHNGQEVKGPDLPDALDGKSDYHEKSEIKHLPDMFFDEHNCDLFDNVHPIKWVDPANDQVSESEKMSWSLTRFICYCLG